MAKINFNSITKSYSNVMWALPLKYFPPLILESKWYHVQYYFWNNENEYQRVLLNLSWVYDSHMIHCFKSQSFLTEMTCLLAIHPHGAGIGMAENSLQLGKKGAQGN